MEKENIIVNFPEGKDKAELIIRQLTSENELPVKPPVKVDISGTLDAPYEFLSKRLEAKDQIDIERCHLVVNRRCISICLIINENDEYNLGSVQGTLEFHPKFLEFGINQEEPWDPNKLGQFFKMNRAFFLDKLSNLNLVSNLKNFNANINQIIEKQKDDSGSFKNNFSGVVTSNLPGSFKLNIPIFKGRKAEEIEVEFYANIDGRTVNLQLYSPGANETIEALRDSIIDDNIAKFAALAPNLAIIEE